jgi:ABC-type glutathione transport system ATPase component
MSSAGADAPVLAVRDVGRVFRRRGVSRVALVGVTFDLEPNRTLAVVGESGAGKSTLARLIAGLDRPTTGRVLVDGRSPRLRGGLPSPVQMVFQDPKDALNPFLSVGRSVSEPLRKLPRRERRHRMWDLLEQVGLDPARAGQRPSAFSGGQLQRVVFARALAASPRILVCDEPTSALDVSVQAQIVNLLLHLQRELGFACVLVTHDLSIVRALADDVLVLRRGELIEQSRADDFFHRPAQEYSRSLLNAVAQQSLARHDWFAGGRTQGS